MVVEKGREWSGGGRGGWWRKRLRSGGIAGKASTTVGCVETGFIFYFFKNFIVL